MDKKTTESEIAGDRLLNDLFANSRDKVVPRIVAAQWPSVTMIQYYAANYCWRRDGAHRHSLFAGFRGEQGQRF